jgi:lipopolysaccharide/colanic/teichoic acid biosynthesis glycosyltransferase
VKPARGPGFGGISGPAHAVTALLLGSATVLILEALTGLHGLGALGLLAGLQVSSVAIGRRSAILNRGRGQQPSVRIAVIGGAAVAERMRSDLGSASRRFEFAGRIAPPGGDDDSGRALAELDGLRQAVVEHGIGLLILSSSVPRLLVFDRLVSCCLDLPVKLVELTSFYEAVFGYVPISEMNVVWFQYLVDPYSRLPHRFVKRAIDLVGAALLAVPALPLCGVLMLVVRRDGGPGIFRQERIGEGGRTFTLYKLRTMRPSSGSDAQWAAIDDPRVTPSGRLLRCTHLDELPQLLNVLRGEMSLVGPRPEQPPVVERLERDLPFYQRRHLIRPGITGWAQIRCGYARSDLGSMWKHCHDLYYLKHRSIRIDLWILLVSVRLALLGAVRRTEVITKSTPPVEAATPQTLVDETAAQVFVGGNSPASPR